MSLCSLITETQTGCLDAMKRLTVEVKIKLATCPCVHQSLKPKLGAWCDEAVDTGSNHERFDFVPPHP